MTIVTNLNCDTTEKLTLVQCVCVSTNKYKLIIVSNLNSFAFGVTNK